MMSRVKWSSLNTPLLLLVIISAGAFSDTSARLQADAIIHNVIILDVNDGLLTPSMAVVVIDGQISDIVSDKRIRDYDSQILIDGRKGFLIPALADVHVHIQAPSELQSYVRYGVGLVVNMAGGPQHLSMKNAVASGEMVGPLIVTAGPTLDGDPPTNPLFISVNPDSAGEVVKWIDNQGYDLVKVYQQLNAETLSAVVATAKSEGLITAGHVSRETGINQVLDAGLRYIAHGEELAFEAFDEVSRIYNLDAVPALANLLAQNGATVTPMLAYLKNISLQVNNLNKYLGTEQMRLLPAVTRMSFDQLQGWFANRNDPDAFVRQIASLAAFVEALTIELQQQGVHMVLGTDAGFGGAISGYSVHEELEVLVQAGLSELTALQLSTLNVGRYLQRIDETRTPWGQIKPGFSASVLLLGGNPLEDITSTQEIQGVMVNGQWHDSDSLKKMKETLITNQQTLLPIAQAFEGALVVGNVAAARKAMNSVPAELANEPLISAANCIFLGYRHYYGGDRPVAGRLYELCADMNPHSAELLIHIARAYETENKQQDAVRAYRQALELNPWYGDPQSSIDRLTAQP